MPDTPEKVVRLEIPAGVNGSSMWVICDKTCPKCSCIIKAMPHSVRVPRKGVPDVMRARAWCQDCQADRWLTCFWEGSPDAL